MEGTEKGGGWEAGEKQNERAGMNGWPDRRRRKDRKRQMSSWLGNRFFFFFFRMER